MSGPWLGHHDLCALSWGEPCDCITPEERAALCECGYRGDERNPDADHYESCPNFEPDQDTQRG